MYFSQKKKKVGGTWSYLTGLARQCWSFTMFVFTQKVSPIWLTHDLLKKAQFVAFMQHTKP